MSTYKIHLKWGGTVFRAIVFILVFWLTWGGFDVLASGHTQPKKAQVNYVVYSVNQGLPLGGETPDELKSLKDFYVNMGREQGLRKGSVLEVRRRVSSYDLLAEQLYRDLTVPIARIRVIHADSMASVARLETFLSAKNNPIVTPRAVMVGDLVRDTGMLALQPAPKRAQRKDRKK